MLRLADVRHHVAVPDGLRSAAGDGCSGPAWRSGCDHAGLAIKLTTPIEVVGAGDIEDRDGRSNKCEQHVGDLVAFARPHLQALNQCQEVWRCYGQGFDGTASLSPAASPNQVTQHHPKG